ncbi:E3 ubiquitin-protein ligase WAV3-like [Humulus lupulus]|uniref:E3 ubiquitin-protein ligase WAV3-like n=1 Tax=Humulus lupulus TaxID=3486 RepID=UPI002B40937F|nr:E3 ubiquitin-protein ligase WAV3-like [Humulus lupulus]XP_062113432.1 E3 ubiquitin-protein ligase WAV3-like [Humulus lupulus]XP_062113442.1 E3 ubiquitin-protein ligase WAV3-like [Humulus lupulus]XP_062113443.1 E3 ubiquitin-protein ligase WAV3-like [Humulus lupulus]
MSFNDDQPIVATTQDVSEERYRSSFVAGKIKMSIFNKTEAPLEETKFKVVLELTGSGLGNDRPGVDLVTVLDVSGSMEGEKLDKMKTAMQFVIKKLSPIDRLSVVTFDANSKRLCPLRQITESAQSDIENIVNDLKANGGTNITAGLETGLKVINDRTLSSGRVAAIILMSDGKQNAGCDAAQVDIGDIVPVFTFGFGAKHDPRVLNAIADNSKGGTFSVVQNRDTLSVAFAQCLAGLLTVVVQDLELTVTQVETESTIENVRAGRYPQYEGNEAGSVMISFGDLYDKEIRKVVVDLVLPSVGKRAGPGADIIQIDYTYSNGGKPFSANTMYANVRRTGANAEEKEEVLVEENRLQTAMMVKEARSMADQKRLQEARDMILDAQRMLDDESTPDNPLIEMLRIELQQLQRLMKSQQMYENKGRPFALSSETSHDRQRFATRGDAEKLRLFATPRMDAYLDQAKAFDEDPSQPLPTSDQDMLEELAADPLGPIAGALSYHIQSAIQSLQAIDKIINKAR